MTRLRDITDAADAVLTCREMGHAWEWVNDPVVHYQNGAWARADREDRCLRCGTTRTRTIELPSGAILSTRMSYPDGYLAAKGTRFSRTDARRETLSRFVRAVATRQREEVDGPPPPVLD